MIRFAIPAVAAALRQDEEALHLRDHEGWTYKQLAERFGRSRSTMSGALYRVDCDADAHSDHGDGTLPPRWWARRRSVAA